MGSPANLEHANRTPSSGSSADAQRAQAAVLDLSRHAETFTRFRRVTLIGLVAWPMFAVADVLALETFGRGAAPLAVLGPRLGFTLVGAAGVIWLYRKSSVSMRGLIAFDQFMYGFANVLIGVMCLSLGGLQSPYVVGACLVVTARMLSLPFEWKRALVSNAWPALATPLTVAAGVFFTPTLRPQLSDPNALAMFALDLAYLVGTAIIMATGSHIVNALRTQLSAERSIGRYRLRHRLGQGGMGEVWAAWHSGLKRDVALKILKPGSADTTAATRFEREVRATSELTHPNTVRVFDYGVTDDGLLYYAMELLRGEDLGSLIDREGALDPRRAVYLLSQAARALAEAHAHGIVHRDVKPENLFVTAAGSEADFVKVLDFGIVRIEGVAPTEAEQRLTSQGAVVGTPRYMAPEVMRGAVATGRADVYGLGAVLYLALMGQPPFATVNKLELVGLVLGPLEAAPIDRPGVSPELAAVVARALAKDPARRYENAGALSEALRAVPEAGTWQPARVEVAPMHPAGAPHGPTSLTATPGPTPASSATETGTVEAPKPRP